MATSEISVNPVNPVDSGSAKTAVDQGTGSAALSPHEMLSKILHDDATRHLISPGPIANVPGRPYLGRPNLAAPKQADAAAVVESEDGNSYSLGDLLRREAYVLGGAREAGAGAKDRAKEAAQSWPLTALEVVGGVAIGSAMVLASRNPALAVPIKMLNRTMMTVAAIDLASRVAVPSVDALVHPEHATADRHAVGHNLGAAVFDYGMAAISGGAGSRAAAPLVERTRFGSLVQGYDFFKTPGGAEVRVFKSGDALISRNGARVYRSVEQELDPLSSLNQSPRGIVGDNDLLRSTFNDGAKEGPASANQWRSGKEILESAGKFNKWFETVAGALAERTVDIGFGLLAHDYLTSEVDATKPQLKVGKDPQDGK